MDTADIDAGFNDTLWVIQPLEDLQRPAVQLQRLVIIGGHLLDDAFFEAKLGALEVLPGDVEEKMKESLLSPEDWIGGIWTTIKKSLDGVVKPT